MAGHWPHFSMNRWGSVSLENLRKKGRGLVNSKFIARGEGFISCFRDNQFFLKRA